MSMGDCTSVLRRKHIGIFLAFTAAAASLWAAPPVNIVKDVRYWSVGEVTRVAIEVSGEFHFRSERLKGPDRLFFDIPDARPAMVEKGIHTINVGDALLKSIRIAETQPGVTRVVLDLQEHVDFNASQLSNPERLMIELRVKGAPLPRSSATTTTAPPPAMLPQPPPVAAAPVVETAPVVTAPVITASASRIPPPAPAPKQSRPATVEPKPATRNSNGDRSLTRVLGLKLGRIVIDPGHGGHDQGTHSKSGLLEKDLVLDISKRLAAMLEEKMSAQVVLTRKDDTFVSLEERTEIANTAKADLFLSIHANSSPVKSVAGVETYYLNFSASREDLDLATRENATAESTIGDLREVISKIALRAKLDESREFALRVQKALHTMAVSQNKEARDRGIKKAPFVVLIGADMPSVLAEIGFLSNSRDEKLLETDEHRDRIAKSLYDGIVSYMQTLSQSELARLE